MTSRRTFLAALAALVPAGIMRSRRPTSSAFDQIGGKDLVAMGKTPYTFDVFYGAKTVRPELAARLSGPDTVDISEHVHSVELPYWLGLDVAVEEALEEQPFSLADEDLRDFYNCGQAQGIREEAAQFYAGEFAPPVHPNCRCVISPVEPWEEHLPVGLAKVEPITITGMYDGDAYEVHGSIYSEPTRVLVGNGGPEIVIIPGPRA